MTLRKIYNWLRRGEPQGIYLHVFAKDGSRQCIDWAPGGPHSAEMLREIRGYFDDLIEGENTIRIGDGPVVRSAKDEEVRQ